MALEPRTLRVLHIVNDLDLGGAQRAVSAQVAALGRARFAPRVASLELVPDGPLAAELERAGVPVHRLRRAGEPRARALPRLVALLRSTAPDLVHTHLAAAGVVGRMAVRLVGVPRVVSTLHNLSDWQERRAHPLRLLERGTLPLADAVIAVSEAVRGACARGCPWVAGRLVTLPNGVDLAAFAGVRRNRAEARAVLGLAPAAFVVAAVARLELRKGIDVLLEALALAMGAGASLHALVVGDGPARAGLERLARARGLADRVTWLGARSDVRPALAAADLLAAPSRTEGLGVAAIEALAAGLPVLASRVGGLPELLEDAGCGLLLPPGEPAAWAAALAALAADRERLERMAAAAPARAARYSLAASARALERLYEELLEPAPAERAEAA